MLLLPPIFFSSFLSSSRSAAGIPLKVVRNPTKHCDRRVPRAETKGTFSGDIRSHRFWSRSDAATVKSFFVTFRLSFVRDRRKTMTLHRHRYLTVRVKIDTSGNEKIAVITESNDPDLLQTFKAYVRIVVLGNYNGNEGAINCLAPTRETRTLLSLFTSLVSMWHVSLSVSLFRCSLLDRSLVRPFDHVWDTLRQ